MLTSDSAGWGIERAQTAGPEYQAIDMFAAGALGSDLRLEITLVEA